MLISTTPSNSVLLRICVNSPLVSSGLLISSNSVLLPFCVDDACYSKQPLLKVVNTYLPTYLSIYLSRIPEYYIMKVLCNKRRWALFLLYLIEGWAYNDITVQCIINTLYLVHPLLRLLRGLLGGQDARRCPLQLIAVRLCVVDGISDQLSKFFWVALVDGNVLRELRVETEVEGGRKEILEYRMDSWGGGGGFV